MMSLLRLSDTDLVHVISGGLIMIRIAAKTDVVTPNRNA
jgi:hypothetical protein